MYLLNLSLIYKYNRTYTAFTVLHDIFDNFSIQKYKNEKTTNVDHCMIIGINYTYYVQYFNNIG